MRGERIVHSDCIVFVADPFPFNQEYERALVKPLYATTEVRFVCIPTLIRMKELAGRPQDQIDIEHLRMSCRAMGPTEFSDESIDWRLTTFEGARREQLRRWAELPLEQIILALEEMEDLAARFEEMRDKGRVSG